MVTYAQPAYQQVYAMPRRAPASKALVVYSKPKTAYRTKPRGRQVGYQRTAGFYGRFKGPTKELKFFDTALSFNVDATGEVPATGQLILIPQGDTESSRDGRLAMMKSIFIRGTATLVPAAASAAATTVYIYVVMDMQTNGAAASNSDVWTSANYASAQRNLQNSSRFKILHRFRITMNPSAGVAGALNWIVRPFEWFGNLNVTTSFGGATGALTEIKDNNIFLMAGSDNNSDDLVQVAGSARIRFYD